MAGPKLRTGETVPCDFCTDQIAVLYCRADTAKLCLFCDQHVHSANQLSRKHIRSQICDNCGSDPVSVRCAMDNLVLCQECDWDAHGSCSVSAAHDRSPIEGFSGCPSALELAAIWGLDLQDKKPANPNWVGSRDSVLGFSGYQDLIVPNGTGLVYPNVEYEDTIWVSKRQNQSPSCGKYKQVIFKQLTELLKRDFIGGGDGGGGGDGDGGGGGDLVPEAPIRSGWQQGNVEAMGFRNGSDGINHGVEGIMAANHHHHHYHQQQQAPFTSILLLQTQANNPKGSDGDMMWDNNSRNQSTQIWDFNLGRLRGQEESGLDVGYGSSDTGGFMMKNFGELMKETSMTNSKALGDLYQMNCSLANEDITSYNNNVNNLAASQGPATSESNNLPIARQSPLSAFGKSKGTRGLKEMQFAEHSFLVSGDTIGTASTSKADMELLAQNRGNAMLRYKEKKKT